MAPAFAAAMAAATGVSGAVKATFWNMHGSLISFCQKDSDQRPTNPSERNPYSDEREESLSLVVVETVGYETPEHCYHKK